MRTFVKKIIITQLSIVRQG